MTRVQLVPIESDIATIDITKDLMLVGRKDDCDIHLDHKSISKQHCVIVKSEGLLLLRDLGSTNGTRVNGQRVRRAALLPNDQINIASLKFRVTFSEEAVESAIAPEEYTEHLDAKEMARLLKKTTEDDDEDADEASEEFNLPPMQANVLPDLYEDKPERKK